jgi:radical SAM superfamily enzyme YgiQ (UPF0313 family)
VSLIATYEMGRQPFGLASPAAWLRERGAIVRMIDASRERVPPDALSDAHLVAFHLPMHTATRLAMDVIERAARVVPRPHLCAYGLYAPLNITQLRSLGVNTILGGEFEAGLVRVAERLATELDPSALDQQVEPEISWERLDFRVPDRVGLPPLDRYAALVMPDGRSRTVGYTEASRGCKHTCCHCPIVPVYGGRFRVVPIDTVIQDIAQQVDAGAEHITFGDPDFFNGITHAVKLVTRLHERFPQVTYDVTIKVEHLLAHQRHLQILHETGCAFVVSAFESFDDEILRRLDKGHTAADAAVAVERCERAGLVLSPTFVAFTPWTTSDGYARFLAGVDALGLVEHVASVQLGIRLLVPAGSKLLELPDVRAMTGPFNEAALVHPWNHPDPGVDALQKSVEKELQRLLRASTSRRDAFDAVYELAAQADPRAARCLPARSPRRARATIPYLTEPWFC